MAEEIKKAAEGLGGHKPKSEHEPKAEAKAEAKSPAKEQAESGRKKIAEMHVKFHKGGMVVTHKHHPPHHKEEHDEAHVVSAAHEGDLDNLHDHFEHHAGGPNAGEAELAPGVIPQPENAGAGAEPAPQQAAAAPPAAAGGTPPPEAA